MTDDSHLNKKHLDAYRRSGVDAAQAGDLIKGFLSSLPKHDLWPSNYFCQLISLPPAFAPEPSYLAMGTDGVGTKLLLAVETEIYRGLGRDLVGMVYNDLMTSGCRPLAFLDYYATGRLAPQVYREVLESIHRACETAQLPLLGGETAEMPDMYDVGHFDLAGFGVGIVAESDLLSPSKVKPGDLLMAFPSSGFHSNGYSLVRRIIDEKGLDLDEIREFAGKKASLKEHFMEPTRLYTEIHKKVLEKEINLKALVHITGGGYLENLPRALSPGSGVALRRSAFDGPSSEIFHWFANVADLSWEEMMATFNCGYAMVALVSPEEKDRLCEVLPEGVLLGEVEPTDSEEKVRITS